MEKMTSGCYGELVNRCGCSWVGRVHNKEPPAENVTQKPPNTTRL